MGRGPISISIGRLAASSPPRITISDDSCLFYSHYSTHTERTTRPRTFFPLEIRETASRSRAMTATAPAIQTPSGSDGAASPWETIVSATDIMVWFAGRRYTVKTPDIATKIHCISKEQKNYESTGTTRQNHGETSPRSEPALFPPAKLIDDWLEWRRTNSSSLSRTRHG